MMEQELNKAYSDYKTQKHYDTRKIQPGNQHARFC